MLICLKNKKKSKEDKGKRYFLQHSLVSNGMKDHAQSEIWSSKSVPVKEGRSSFTAIVTITVFRGYSVQQFEASVILWARQHFIP